MDVRVHGFVQRTIRKISSWNFKKLQPLGPVLQEAIATFDNPPQEQIVLFDNLVLQEAVETLDSPSEEQTIKAPVLQEAITTLDIAAVEEEIEANQPEPQDNLQYTDGEARIIGVHDGFKNCFALLLNKDMVAKLQAITEASHKLSFIENSLENAKMQATIVEVAMNQIQDSLDATDDEEETVRIREDIKRMESELRHAYEKRDDLETDVTNLRFSLESSRAYSHDLFERVLGEANLLNISELEPEAVPSAPGTPISRRSSVALSQSSQSSICSDERNRWVALEEVELTTMALQKLETDFYYQRSNYEKEREIWSQEVQEGVCQLSKTVFDNSCLVDAFQLTRNLIEAEDAREEAVSRAWELGVLQNNFETESHFVDDVDDGYSLSLETSMKASVDRDFIVDWTNGVCESRDRPLLRPDSEEDERWDAKWDGQSVRMSEGFSILDESRNQKRIARWEETCDIQHQQSERLRREIVGSEIPERPEEMGPLTRRNSCSL